MDTDIPAAKTKTMEMLKQKKADTDIPATKPVIMAVLKTKGMNRKQRRDWYKKHKSEDLRIVKEKGRLKI